MLPPILLVTEVFPPAIGGSGVLFDNVYRRLRDSRVTVLTDGPADAADRRGALPVHHVSMKAPDWGLLRPSCLRRHLRVARAIRRLTPPGGRVHCGRGLPEGLSAWMAQRAGGAPYVCWTHGEELGFASTSRELAWLMRGVLGSAVAVIANSRNSAGLLTREWGVPAARVHVVHPGVDVQRFRPDIDASGLRGRLSPGHEVVFLSVGRLQRRKGHDLVLEALPEVIRQAHVRYVVAGDGPHRSVLEARAQALGLGEVVEFLGVVSEDDLPALYRAADVFVMPNRMDGVDFEGFGIVFLEAAAAGLPAIAGATGGAAEAVVDGVTGRLVSGTDAGELARVMIDLAHDPGCRAAMGDAGRRRCVSGFTWDSAADALAGALSGTAAPHGRRAAIA